MFCVKGSAVIRNCVFEENYFLQILPDALKMNINILKKHTFFYIFSIPYSRRPLLTEHNAIRFKNMKKWN